MSISFSPSEVIAITAAFDVLRETEESKGSSVAPFEMDALLVERAFARFSREFAAYSQGQSPLREVRRYHRLLIDTLAPFAGGTVV